MAYLDEQHYMYTTRRALLGTVAVASVAGCLDGGGGGDTPTPTDDGMGTPTPTGMTGEMATVQARSHADLGEILVGPDGMTLYMFDSDTSGDDSSACTGGCADTWPPLTVDGMPTAGDEVTAELDTFERSDGETQVTANGWPLYHYSGDESPGDANGQGVGNVWWVLDPAGEPVQSGGMATPTPTGGGGQGTSPTATATPTGTPTSTPTPTQTDSGGGYY